MLLKEIKFSCGKAILISRVISRDFSVIVDRCGRLAMSVAIDIR